jgi:hypothetical protein
MLNATVQQYALLSDATNVVINGTCAIYASYFTSPSNSAQSLMVMLPLTTGATPTKRQPGLVTLTTVFRKPLLDGQSWTTLSPSTNTTGLTSQVSNLAALGDAQMQQAYMAGYNRMLSAGTWDALFNTEPFFAPYDVCMGSASVFPFPAAPLSGAMAAILASGTVRLGYNPQVYLSPSGLVLMNGTASPPVGSWVTLTAAIIASWSANYGVTLTPEWHVYASTDAMGTDMLAGKIDMMPAYFHVGRSVQCGAMQRRAAPCCCGLRGRGRAGISGVRASVSLVCQRPLHCPDDQRDM